MSGEVGRCHEDSLAIVRSCGVVSASAAFNNDCWCPAAAAAAAAINEDMKSLDAGGKPGGRPGEAGLLAARRPRGEPGLLGLGEEAPLIPLPCS